MNCNWNKNCNQNKYEVCMYEVRTIEHTHTHTHPPSLPVVCLYILCQNCNTASTRQSVIKASELKT